MKTALAAAFASLLTLAAASDAWALQGMIAPSRDLDFAKTWTHLPPSTAPKLETLDDAQTGETFIVYLLVGDFALDKNGNADVSVDVRISGPNGATYFEASGQDAVKGPRDPKLIQLAAARVGNRFEAADPFGVYEVTATFRDAASGKSVIVKRKIEHRAKRR